MRLVRFASVAFVSMVGVSLAACSPSGGTAGRPARSGENARAVGREIADDAFAKAVHDLLMTDPHSQARVAQLEGVVGRQMTRVAARFRSKEPSLAVASFVGAMLLVRSGELTSAMLGSRGHEALRFATEEFSKRGDEGRARASYEMLARIAPPSAQAEIKAHLDAIAAWTRDTAGGGVMRTAGALETAAVQRHLLEPSQEARSEAESRTLDFIEKASSLRTARRTRGAQITREEGVEAVRALETGATVLAAVSLRNADAKGALEAVTKVREFVRPELMRLLESVVASPDAAKWLDLARFLRPSSSRTEGEEEDFGRDSDLVRSASFVAASEAFRLDPKAPEPAVFLGAMLVDLGMGEATPAVLAEAVRAQNDPRFTSLALAVTMQAMGTALEADDAEEVRRTFRAAQPILLVAAGTDASRLSPSPARVYGMMGEIEMREGRLPEARKHLAASVASDKSAGVLLSLARLDGHEGQRAKASANLSAALASPDVSKDPALRAEVKLFQSELLRDAGDTAAARASLGEALRGLAGARGTIEGTGRARVERLLARVLDRYGADKRATLALDRALEAAPHDKHEAAATIGQIVGRAFLKNDVVSARDGLLRGLAVELAREDLVYYAMWVRVLERQQKLTTDNTAEKVLLDASSDPRWIGRIAAFGAGKLDGAGLLAAALTPAQTTEATFYAALERRVKGDTKGANELLKKVTELPGVELMESALARDLLRGDQAKIGGPVPEVAVP